jgi:hypothetical protein
MDLITLVAACALTVDPKVMHALIWHQSGGEPWSFSVPGEHQPYVYRSAKVAVVEARRSGPTGLPIRIGLTGLPVVSEMATTAMLMPCANISIAARQISQLIERCEVAPLSAGDSIRCGIAAYHGSWDSPDNKFADAVLTSAAKGDAPDFDMPGASDGRLDAAASEFSVSGQPSSTERSGAADDQRQAWSSALFPARAKQVDGASSMSPDVGRLQESTAMAVRPMTPPSRDDGLFVRRSPERRPQ